MKLLSLIIFLPLAGAVVTVFLPERLVKFNALVATLLTLCVTLFLAAGFNTELSGMQFLEDHIWIHQLGIHYTVGVDGLSILMVLLTGLLSTLAVIASWKITKQPRGYFALFLLLQSAMTGVFVALDLFLFFIFWEFMLLPMYFLIGIWGTPARVEADGRTRGGPYAAIKFFLFTFIGSLVMLVGIIWLWTTSTSFDWRQLVEVRQSFELQLVLWFLFFAAFAVKVPMVPFHTWLPDAHVEAPTPISVILAGVLLKMGTYGLIRFNCMLFPDAAMTMSTPLACFGVINIVYGALCAMAQTDLKRLVAYASVSHMGFVLLGIAAFTTESLSGAVLHMANHGTITAMLFLLVGVIYDRTGHRDITRLGGLSLTMPRYAAFVTLAFFASLGIPGLSGFVGELLVLLGSWQAGGVFRFLVAAAGIGIVIGAGYHLWVLQRAFLGEEKREYHGLSDISPLEALTIIPLAIIVIAIGIYPAPALGLITKTVTLIVQ